MINTLLGRRANFQTKLTTSLFDAETKLARNRSESPPREQTEGTFVQSMSVNWAGYTITLGFPHGISDEVTTPIDLQVSDATGASAGSGYLRLRREGHEDSALGRLFDVLVLSNLDIASGHSRRGLGTAIVRILAQQFPEALIVGENPNQDAQRWHATKLEATFPTRMLRADVGDGVRVTPGIELDKSELS